jgi:heat shock protein HtpX
VAHEIGHIVNRDTRFITMAAVLMGTIVMISDMFLRSLRFAGGRGRTSGRGKNGGQAAAVLFLIALALAILAPILARLLYFACSRRREYLADASGALFTRYPEGLASALEKIARRSDLSTNANRTLAPLCTVNPLQGFSASGLFSTHPPTDLRIRVLRGMAGGAGYVDYDSAFKKVLDRTSGCIGPRTLGAARPAPVRGPSAAGIAPAAGETPPAAEVGGLLDRLANYTLIPCACGLKIKIPPALKMASVTCPRCGKHHRVPAATAKGETGTETPGGPGAAPEAEQPGAEVLPPLQYQRRSKGWESFRCACGHTLQVSPEFVATHLDCPKCRRHIEIS